jgi:AcrR family transcriptional regulator
MARKRTRPKPRVRTLNVSGRPAQERVIDALLELLAEKPFEQIGLTEIAERAGISLAELRNLYSSSVAILAAHIKRIDEQVLSGSDTDMADEPPRERLFDVLMRRLEALAPYKPAIRSLLRSAMCDPGLAFALNGLSVRSQQWMLTAAGISAAGPKGLVRAQGLALLYASVLRTWLDDDDPGLASTLAALDSALARGQRWSGFLDDLCSIPGCVGRRRQRSRRGGEKRAAA